MSSEYVALVSSDNFEFVVSRKAAEISGTLRHTLNSSFRESKDGKIKLHEIDSVVLSKVVEYLYYNLKYRDQVDAPEFDIPTEMALELLVASDFLDM